MSQSEFWDAAKAGNLVRIKELIESAADTIDMAAHDNHAIRLAALYGHLNVLRYLVEKAPMHGQTVDVTAKDNAALLSAAFNGCLDMVRYLVEEAPKHGQKPVDVTARDYYAVCAAAANRHLDVYNYLVEVVPFFTGQVISSSLVSPVFMATEDAKKLFDSKRILLQALEAAKKLGIDFQKWKAPENRERFMLFLKGLAESGTSPEDWKGMIEEHMSSNTSDSETGRTKIRI